jgi:hypothetical protein
MEVLAAPQPVVALAVTVKMAVLAMDSWNSALASLWFPLDIRMGGLTA